jgi:hypothetical protein
VDVAKYSLYRVSSPTVDEQPQQLDSRMTLKQTLHLRRFVDFVVVGNHVDPAAPRLGKGPLHPLEQCQKLFVCLVHPYDM